VEFFEYFIFTTHIVPSFRGGERWPSQDVLFLFKLEQVREVGIAILKLLYAYRAASLCEEAGGV